MLLRNKRLQSWLGGSFLEWLGIDIVSRLEMIISHDYSILQGVRDAFSEFTEHTREKLIELPTTQCMMIKAGT